MNEFNYATIDPDMPMPECLRGYVVDGRLDMRALMKGFGGEWCPPTQGPKVQQTLFNKD